jgi:hypothetical protein
MEVIAVIVALAFVQVGINNGLLIRSNTTDNAHNRDDTN